MITVSLKLWNASEHGAASDIFRERREHQLFPHVIICSYTTENNSRTRIKLPLFIRQKIFIEKGGKGTVRGTSRSRMGYRPRPIEYHISRSFSV